MFAPLKRPTFISRPNHCGPRAVQLPVSQGRLGLALWASAQINNAITPPAMPPARLTPNLAHSPIIRFRFLRLRLVTIFRTSGRDGSISEVSLALRGYRVFGLGVRWSSSIRSMVVTSDCVVITSTRDKEIARSLGWRPPPCSLALRPAPVLSLVGQPCARFEHGPRRTARLPQRSRCCTSMQVRRCLAPEHLLEVEHRATHAACRVVAIGPPWHAARPRCRRRRVRQVHRRVSRLCKLIEEVLECPRPSVSLCEEGRQA